MAYTRPGIRSFAQALLAKPFASNFHGVRTSSLLGNTYCFNSSGCVWRILAAGLSYSIPVCPKCDSNWDLKTAPYEDPFDICRKGHVAKFSGYQIPSEDEEPGPGLVLRPGMVLLKDFLAFTEQKFIVRECRYLGLRRAGFYWAYEHTMLMYLGLDWEDGDRAFDQCRPSYIPPKFLAMMTRALIAAQDLIKSEDEDESTDVESVLPMIAPDICLVKFHTSQDQLGLRQANDGSKESLAKGLPIVLMSVGDSAEFFYGDTSDECKAEKVVLESGDVLIFGGPSRHIFHEVRSVIPGTAHDALRGATNLRHGRLDLTFRENCQEDTYA